MGLSEASLDAVGGECFMQERCSRDSRISTVYPRSELELVADETKRTEQAIRKPLPCPS